MKFRFPPWHELTKAEKIFIITMYVIGIAGQLAGILITLSGWTPTN